MFLVGQCSCRLMHCDHHRPRHRRCLCHVFKKTNLEMLIPQVISLFLS